MDASAMDQNGIAFMHGLPQGPPLVNQPPRIFGNYDMDATQMPPSLSGNMFNEDDLNYEGGDQGDSKRRRIARACDQCRRKKIKCDGKQPSCTHCQNYKTECVFTQVEKKRQPPKGAKYIEGLENRLGRMESLLRLSGLLSEEDDGRTDLGTLEKRLVEKAKSSTTTKQSSEKSPKVTSPGGEDESLTDARPSSSEGMQETSKTASKPPSVASPKSTVTSPQPGRAKSVQEQTPQPETERKEEEVEALSDMMCSLVTNNCGETRYIGSSSGFSIFSPKGIQWVNEKTGDASFQEMISTASIEDNKWIHWKPDVFRDIFDRKVYKQLPPKHEALSLLKDFFENFNCMFPLFHEPTFMHLVDKHYERDPYEGSGWWASFNVALAIAHRLRVMSNLVPQEEDQKAWGYLKNAMAVQSELTIRNTDLLSVQALLGMALFLMGTPNPQPSFFLVAAAIRLSHSIGLHKRGSGFNLSPGEIEQRKRVFWIAYMLDRDICLRSGRPPIQDDDDMNVELPSEDPPDNIGNIPLADGKGKVNLFRLMCTFAVIESKVYRGLYSCKAAKQSDGELLNTIGELDRELEDWKDGIPMDFRPEHEIKAAHTPLVLHVVVLHFSYYNCLTTIHRMSVHHGYWTSRLSNFAIQGLNARPLNPRVFSSATLCVQAARASIHLIKYVPAGDFSCVWLIIYFPVSALVTLFANILQNPQDTRTRSDLKLMNSVVSFLSKLSYESDSSVKRMLSVCAEFERIAKVVCEKADRETSSRRKRKNHVDKDASKNGSAPPHLDVPRPHVTPQNNERRQSQGFNTPVTPVNGNGFGPSGPGMTPGAYSDTSDPPFPFSPNFTHNSLHGWGADINGDSNMGNMPSSSDMPPSSFMTNGNGTNGANYSPNTPGTGPGGMDMGNSFQQPFVPQELWQMPMTLEWDWADMQGEGGFDGIGMTGVLNGNSNGENGTH
ncbi:hypothetical protein EJ05DRAFT_500573 [Pseudovirgaria hyperparasitica]|uniref:Zn(2)-C6 fungal-type domain-containing protein n=1 Tax=Pseudovirgaria hyperparasitica TaxID=470096 RepID=A0A6A6W842_9PEZI|nr:uncharacterized protein EJ05DRAFT_500573 [Pseudovirgaria hyperparasitica]KAF2758056.1 hypothetical protein EJ05DRAFT_500573 [Pseudovirgaria hyperparasitica]